MSHATVGATVSDRALLREVHEALDLLEHHFNRLPWQRGSGSHIDLLVRLRNHVIAAFPSDGAVGTGLPTAGNINSGARNDQEARRAARED